MTSKWERVCKGRWAIARATIGPWIVYNMFRYYTIASKDVGGLQESVILSEGEDWMRGIVPCHCPERVRVRLSFVADKPFISRQICA
jgi:hypothetical protein